LIFIFIGVGIGFIYRCQRSGCRFRNRLFGVSKRSFDLARTAGLSVGGAWARGFRILDRIDRMLASRKVAKPQSKKNGDKETHR
jgi:hypothetical protein